MKSTITGPFTLLPLPYEQNALEPCISAETFGCHYDKHYKGYVNKLNELVLGTKYEAMKLDELMIASKDIDKPAIFNNAAQVWNHNFYWNSLSPKAGGKPRGDLGLKIEVDFDGYDNFLKEFAEAGVSHFGSGWAWLVEDHGKLKIIKTSNADNPMSEEKGKALLALDVWEHAYYLDYQNQRGDYLRIVLDRLLNWDFADKNFHTT